MCVVHSNSRSSHTFLLNSGLLVLLFWIIQRHLRSIFLFYCDFSTLTFQSIVSDVSCSHSVSPTDHSISFLALLTQPIISFNFVKVLLNYYRVWYQPPYLTKHSGGYWLQMWKSESLKPCKKFFKDISIIHTGEFLCFCLSRVLCGKFQISYPSNRCSK